MTSSNITSPEAHRDACLALVVARVLHDEHGEGITEVTSTYFDCNVADDDIVPILTVYGGVQHVLGEPRPDGPPYGEGWPAVLTWWTDAQRWMAQNALVAAVQAQIERALAAAMPCTCCHALAGEPCRVRPRMMLVLDVEHAARTTAASKLLQAVPS